MQRKPQREEMNLSQLILRYRTDSGDSLAAMAEKVQLSAAGLAKIERGKAKPNRTTELRIVEFLQKHGYFVKQEAVA